MARLCFKMSRTPKVTLAWLVVWMLAVPWVHVHAEADHRHGMPGHVHGGIFHTVLSPELPCVNTPHRADEASVTSREPRADLEVRSPLAHVGDHPAVTFSLLGSKPDSISDCKASQSSEAGLASLGVRSAVVPSFIGTTDPLGFRLQSPFFSCLSSRAPPVALSI